MTCRIIDLHRTRDRSEPHPPFRLTTACGWQTDVPQGTAWAHHPARAEWLAHECRPTEAVKTA